MDSVSGIQASASRPAGPSVLRRWWSGKARIVSAVALALGLGGLVRWTQCGAAEASPEASLMAVLSRDGIRVTEGSIQWLEPDAGPWSGREAVFLASNRGGPTDVWFAEARPGRDGSLLDVAWVRNLTESPGAAEESLVRVGPDAVAFVSRASGSIEALTVLGTRGEPASSLVSFSSMQRLQHAITNLQETGRVSGFARTRFQLHAPSLRGAITAAGRRLTWELDEQRVVVSVGDTIAVDDGADRVAVQALEPGIQPLVPWTVDTIRNLSFVGPAPIEWLENRVFAVQDAVHRARHAVFGSEDTGQAAAADLGMTREAVEGQLSAERRALLTASEAELGWPPAPMESLFPEDPVPGEGAWIPVIDDPFVNAYPGAPPAFVQGFVRPDRERPYVRVYVTLWDARQVQLRVVPGTREPRSATGELGSGTIPRDEQTLRTLVAAFDGGFQAMHGEFGMMADGRVYLPPKPWAATVAVMDDGRVGMGSWPAPNWQGGVFDEALANRQIPAGMVEMRQNLTSMVEDGRWNPWERWWWGAAPQQSEEQTFTYRSGLCLTREGHMGFFWGTSLGPDALGQAMIQARCARAMHLDMNSGHTGFEFFRPYRASGAGAASADGPDAPPVNPDYEADDSWPEAEGWRFRARKAVRSMAMRFPRYTGHDARDFFYLTLRPVLPGPPLADGVAFSTAGLPHAGWPYAFARARTLDTWLVRIDPRRAVATPLRAERHQRLLARFSAGSPSGDRTVVARRTPVGWQYDVGTAGPEDRILLAGSAPTSSTVAAVGVDQDGFLVYAEGPAAASALTLAGISRPVALDAQVRLALVGEHGASAPDGETPRSLDGESGLGFYAEEAPAADVLFPDTQPMPYARWGALQGQRVRYFPDHPPRFNRGQPPTPP